jgi:hypothetical protein
VRFRKAGRPQNLNMALGMSRIGMYTFMKRGNEQSFASRTAARVRGSALEVPGQEMSRGTKQNNWENKCYRQAARSRNLNLLWKCPSFECPLSQGEVVRKRMVPGRAATRNWLAGWLHGWKTAIAQGCNCG